MRDWRLLCDAGLLCALTWTALRRKNAAPGQRSSEKGWHGSAPEPTGQEYKGRREGRIQRDMHAGWVREAWPLQQVSIMCQGSPGTLKADIPDGLRQLARVLRKDSGVFTGGKCGGDRILRWHMVSQIVTDGVPYFSPYPSGGAALPDAYTRAFGPHTDLPDRDTAVVLLQGDCQTPPETLPHFLHTVAAEIEHGVSRYGINDGGIGWAFMTYPAKPLLSSASPGVSQYPDRRTVLKGVSQ